MPVHATIEDLKPGTPELPTLAIDVIDGPLKGTRVLLEHRLSFVGGGPANTLTLQEPGIASRQLEIEKLGDSVRIRDLGCGCGTWLGQFQLGEAQFDAKQPCELRIGTTRLRLAVASDGSVRPSEGWGALIGRSRRMRKLFEQLQRVAPEGATVLLEGETGTGKELIVEELHRRSNRASGPLVIVDCGAMPPSLIESELFGHVQGAFTGATRGRAGVFERANGGTVFFDEVGELGAALQSRLLRILEARQVKRLGENRYRSVDVRIVAATHRPLRQAVHQGEFRSDLFFRLAVVHLRVPALRERPGDLGLLVDHLLPRIAQELGQPTPDLPPQVVQDLETYHWPGNVRELRNYLERTIVCGCPPPQDAMNRHVPALYSRTVRRNGDMSRAEHVDSLPNFHEAKAAHLTVFETQYLRSLLTQCNDNVAAAARQSGIARSHIFRLLHKHGIR